MGYKLKRILIYPDGVTEKQVYPNLMNRPTGVKGGLYLMNGNGNDSSGNGHNGTGGTFTSGKFGQCLNATSSYVNVANNSDFNPVDSEPFSIGFWFKPNQGLNDGTIRGILVKSSSGRWSGSGFCIWKGSGTQNIRFSFGSNLSSTDTSKVFDLTALTITANTRSHICLTYDGTTVKLYQNSILLDSKTMQSMGTGTNTNSMKIGYYVDNSNPNGYAYAKGYMDEVFYMKNYCLSQAEINKIQKGFVS